MLTGRSGDVPFLAKGSTHLVKYSLVERWISLGWAEVL
jgi:GINS complex subunit 4